MKVLIVLSALIVAAFAFNLGKDIQDCFKERADKRNVCQNAFLVVIGKHAAELQKHEKDLSQLPEDVKKAVCCAYNDYRSCNVDAVKGLDDCEAQANKYFDDLEKKDNLYEKVCAKYHKENC